MSANDNPSTVSRIGPDWNHWRAVTFAGMFDTHIETGEDYATVTLAEVFTMQPADAPKGEGPAFIPSTFCEYNAREHATQRDHGEYIALTGDIDSGNHALDHIEKLVRGFVGDAAWLIYSSAHARPNDMRWRVVIPLARTLPYEHWFDAQNAFFNFMDEANVIMDRALDRAAQPVYLPNVPATHEKSGDALRGEDNEPLYYTRKSSGTAAPGLPLSTGPIAVYVAAIRKQREADERERERIRAEAEARRAANPMRDNGQIIDEFNANNSIETLLECYGYERSLRNSDDWRSPHQTSGTYATRNFGDHWISLSASDAAQGVGPSCKSGCYGDAYSLYAHFQHDGDHKAAFRALYAERRAAMPSQSPPPIDTEDPGWTEPPEGPEEGDEPVFENLGQAEAGSTADTSDLGFDIRDWSTARFEGEAPPITWLCEGTIPQAVPALFAAMGGVGKSFIALDLGLEIAASVALDYPSRRILGGKVIGRGSVVVLNAEDSKDSIHRRLAAIDPEDRRLRSDGRLFVIPMPEVGGPMPLVTGDRGEFRKTEKFEALLGQLETIADLKLVIVDPLQAFVTADITKDPAAGQFMWSAFAEICARTGATVIACHHMRKEGMTRIDSSEAAREAIRGSTALIDGARATYALWPTAEEQALRVCAELGIEHQPKRVVSGAVVKSNDEHDWHVHTYVRADSGLLEDHSDKAKVVHATLDRLSNVQVNQSFEEIDARWKAGNPFSAAANSPDRYLPNWLRQSFDISKKAAKDHFDEWMIGGLLISEMVDQRNKKMGIKVKRWPRE